MASQTVNLILEAKDSVSELWSITFAALQHAQDPDGAAFDLSKPIPAIDRSLTELDSRFLAVMDMISSIKGIEEPLLVPTQYLGGLKDALDQLLTEVQGFSNKLENVAQQGGFNNLNTENFTCQSQDGSININIDKEFARPVNTSLDNLLVHYYRLSVITEDKEFNGFSAAAREFGSVLEAIRDAEREIIARGDTLKKQGDQLLEETAQHKSGVGDALTKAQADSAETERLKEEAEKDRKTLAEYAADGTEKIAAIRDTGGQAEQLKTSIEGYQSQFVSFQDQLNSREELLKKGNDEQQKLIRSAQENDAEVTRLIEKSEAMLTGATVAGLAGSFGEIRDNLSTELVSARRAFYFSIFLLALAVVPLLLLVVPAFDPFASTDTARSAAEFIAQAIVRLLLLVPAAWFAKFSAARHAALFRLKEHYVYKYSVASSVEGFKQQAEPFEDAIAAATFFELTFNPADKMETKGHEQRSPNPVMEWIMKKLGTTYDGTRE